MVSAHKTKPKKTGGWTEGSGLPPEEELEYVIWALNGETLFALNGPENDKEWHLHDKLELETREPLRYFVELWEHSGRNLKQMWRDYYVECLPIHKYEVTQQIHLAWGDSNKANCVHTFLDRQGTTPDEEAARFFLTLICNSQNEKLGGPCAGCDRYFMRRTAGNTTYCSRSCGTRATAIAATRRKRAEGHAYKLHCAQAAIEEWEKEHRKGRTKINWKQWVARRQPDVTPHFLTRAVNAGKLKPPVGQ